MNILLTIKAILNYLYNHLIDLIWTKKIRFSDGTEMTTVPVIDNDSGYNLYDIVLLSQAIANKGFAFMCKSSRQDLNKNSVPTLYNDILNKYNNCDKDVEPTLVENVNWTYDNMRIKYNEYNNQYAGYINGIFYYADNINFNNKTSVILQHDSMKFYLGNNINIVFTSDNTVLDIYDTNWNYIKSVDTSFLRNTSMTHGIGAYKGFDKFIFGFGYSGNGQNHQSIYKTLTVWDINVNINTPNENIYTITNCFDTDKLSNNYYITDISSISRLISLYAGGFKANSPFWVLNENETLGWCENENGGVAVYPHIQDNSNGNSTYVLTNSADDIDINTDNGLYFILNYSRPTNVRSASNIIDTDMYAITYENNVYKMYKYLKGEKEFKTQYPIDIETGQIDKFYLKGYFKDIEITNYDENTHGQIIKLLNKNLICMTKGLFRINGNNLVSVFSFNIDNYKDVDFCDIVNNKFILSYGKNYATGSYGSSRFVYSNVSKKVYTDRIRNIDINYYRYTDKNDTWKICVPDNTNDNNLDTVYANIGYLNYYRLDVNNETISIPRDKNTYALMFVGDNYQDNLDLLPTNDYAPPELKNQSSVVYSIINPETINNLQDGTKNTVYQANRSTLIIAGTTNNASDWYLDIQVSINGTDFITIAHYGVSNGDPGSSSLMYLVVGGGLYWKVVTSLTTGNIKYGEIN